MATLVETRTLTPVTEISGKLKAPIKSIHRPIRRLVLDKYGVNKRGQLVIAVPDEGIFSPIDTDTHTYGFVIMTETLVNRRAEFRNGQWENPLEVLPDGRPSMN